jgi:hypothetical protein
MIRKKKYKKLKQLYHEDVARYLLAGVLTHSQSDALSGPGIILLFRLGRR